MRKGLSYYMKMNYQIILRQDVDNGESYFIAEIPDLPGCGSHGKTQEEALKRMEEAKELWIKARLEQSLPISEPSIEENYSGKILVRIPAKLHMALIEKAKRENVSLNLLIRNKLESVLSLEMLQKEISDLKKSVEELCKITQTTTEYNPFPIVSMSHSSGLQVITGSSSWMQGISPDIYRSIEEKQG